MPFFNHKIDHKKFKKLCTMHKDSQKIIQFSKIRKNI